MASKAIKGGKAIIKAIIKASCEQFRDNICYFIFNAIYILLVGLVIANGNKVSRY